MAKKKVLEEEVAIAELNEAVKELPALEAKEQARAYIEEAIIKIDWTHIDKLAIRPILEQVLSFF